jgi:hypothetical protein
MAGLVPAIHDLSCGTKNVVARDKPGHDGVENAARKPICAAAFSKADFGFPSRPHCRV